MKKRKVLRVISVILAFVILLLNIPASAFSVETKMAVTSNNSEEPDNYATDDEIFILEEDTSKRGRFEKHYLCSDGSYFSVTYPESVHYLTVDNQWEDIDLTPEYDTATGKYIKSSGAFGYSFGESASNTNMVEIHSGEYTISWGLEIATEAKENGSDSGSDDMPEDKETILPVSCVKAELSKERDSDNNSGKRYITDSKTFVLSDTSTKIKYSNYTEDCSISLEYTVYQDKIEEDIIINEKGAESFSMSMNIGNLVPVVNSDGSVSLTDEEGTVIFRIGIPYMVDSAFEVCSDISVKAEKTGTRCIITYSPDRTWMNSSDRVYPVVLDPSVSTNDYVSNIEDTYVEENSTVNHSSEQYLYINRNGNNKRKAIVRINQLPIVDEAMPIISAYLVLTAQSESTDFIDMKAAYLDTELDFDDYDYSLTNYLSNTFVEYSYLEDGYSYVEFDISSHIYEMYEDANLDEENGYDYNGDFVIGFEYENDTSYVPPFYSSDYTGVANRPKLIIRYGYSLPAGILNNNVYSFMNYGSACYMSVNGTNPGNNSNIYQLLGNGDGAELFQKFKLEYVSSTGGYLLRSMVSSSGYDKVVSINRGTSGVSENMNIRLSSPGDSIGQEWLIVPVDYYEFKIVPRANMSLAITAYGNSNGSNTGTSYNSSGNIFVKEYDVENNNQRWYIDDSDGEGICTDILRSVIETGTYYVSNYYSGKYLHRNSNTVNCARDKKAVLGENTVRWKIVNLGDGYCTIQRADLPGYYLARDVNSNNGVKVIYSSSETVADKCKWTIRLSSIGCLVKNFNGKYLTYNSSDSTVTLSNLSNSGTDAYKKQQWRIVEKDYYVELGYGVSFNDISLDIGESKSPFVNKSPSSAMWSSNKDFEYTIVAGNQSVSFDNSTFKFLGCSAGIAKIKAEHKTTGIIRYFFVFIRDDVDYIECTIGSTYNIKQNKFNNNEALSHVTWHVTDSLICSVNSQGIITGVKSGYTFVYATINNSEIVFMFEVKINDVHTQMISQLTSNEIEYLYAPYTYLNSATINEPNAFQLKLEILSLFRQYYTLPDSQQPTSQDIPIILANGIPGISCEDDFAVWLYYECYLGYQGLYTQAHLTQSMISYLNYIKQIICFCAFGMASQLDTVNSASSYNGVNELKEDLASCWTNNKESSNVMLGTNYGGRSYVQVAKDGNYKFFYSTDYEYYKNLYGINFVRDVNMRFLDKCFAQNCVFYFSHNPTSYTGGSLYIEYQYIIAHYTQQGRSVVLFQLAANLWTLIVS